MNYVDIFSQILIIFSGIVSLSFYNSLYKRKRSRAFLLSTFVISYVFLALIYLLKLSSLNLLLFIITNIILSLLCYKATVFSSICSCFILTALMMSSEFLFMILSQSIFGTNVHIDMHDSNSILFVSIGSKFSFMVLIFILKIILSFVKKDYNKKEIIYFLTIPIATGILLFIVQDVLEILDTKGIILLFIAVISIIFANLFCFLLYDSILKKNQMVLELKDAIHKNELAFKEYQILEERYNTAKKIEHDINKHFAVLKSLLGEDSIQANEYLNKLIEDKTEKSNLVSLTNNKIFNIILNEKLEKCKEIGINFEYDIQFNKLNFFEDTDTVSIFSNLLDNAIESCQQSEEKNINLDIYPINTNFLTIKISNSCNKKPVQKDNTLISLKKDKASHGFGIKIIKNCLKKYKGSFNYDYNKDTNLFTVIIVINLS